LLELLRNNVNVGGTDVKDIRPTFPGVIDCVKVSFIRKIDAAYLVLSLTGAVVTNDIAHLLFLLVCCRKWKSRGLSLY
jgi:hypothetical protein